MGGVFGIITAIVIVALGYFLFVKAAKPIYNLNEWTGRLWQWAEQNGISRRKLPRYEENLVELTELNISFHELTDIPSELCNITSLMQLVADDNKLTLLPKEITNLINLTKLSLDGNLLTKIPQELFNLVKLQKLSLENNKLTVIPKEIANLTSLKEINLSNNHLSSLPDEIMNLKLESFFISGNSDLNLTKKQKEWIKSIKDCDWTDA
ncbi:MAG: leucine-rich repeat domain-containing protein [Campylobacteraceae bacterium]|jgi:Leucine-rich repeat (LRR) protein|nr:leucine-rich repeat domain-containing protein [Campylobacteraceae bacterium]